MNHGCHFDEIAANIYMHVVSVYFMFDMFMSILSFCLCLFHVFVYVYFIWILFCIHVNALILLLLLATQHYHYYLCLHCIDQQSNANVSWYLSCMPSQHSTWATQISQINSNQISSNQIKSNQSFSNQVKSNQANYLSLLHTLYTTFNQWIGNSVFVSIFGHEKKIEFAIWTRLDSHEWTRSGHEKNCIWAHYNSDFTE